MLRFVLFTRFSYYFAFVTLLMQLTACTTAQKPAKTEAELRMLMKDYVIAPSVQEQSGALDFTKNKHGSNKKSLKISASEKTKLNAKSKQTKSAHASKEIFAKSDVKNTNPSTRQIRKPAPSAKNLEMQEGESKLYQHFLYSVRAKDYKSATRAFRLLKKAYPESQLLAEAHYQLALYAIQKNNDKTALKHISVILEQYPKSQRRASAMLNKAEIFQRIHLQESSITLFQQITKSFPGSTESLIASERLKMIKNDLPIDSNKQIGSKNSSKVIQ